MPGVCRKTWYELLDGTQPEAKDHGGGMSGALLHGRTEATLNAAQDATDALFSSTLADGWSFSDRTYTHCTFANISFKDATLKDCVFLDCAFLDCYFRGTKVVATTFTGCKFEDCSFSDLTFVDPAFEFPTFRGCFIPYKDATHLPADPGYRFKMADELARESAASGAAGDAREYRLAGAKAYESHLWNIALAVGSDYYRVRFEQKDRVKAVRSYIWRRINRALWGYGERGWVLARSFFLVGALAFPAVFWLFFRNSLTLAGKAPLGFVDYELFSFDNLLNRTGFSGVAFSGASTKTVVGLQVLAGLFFIGLFISLIFNWMRRR